jgi:hypothetical protein
LAENNWLKSHNSKVNASGLRARYIDTGIANFVSGRYPYGCLAGYILEGSADKILVMINKLLKSKKRNRPTEILRKIAPINDHQQCYQSEHKNSKENSLQLNHIFLVLNDT